MLAKILSASTVALVVLAAGLWQMNQTQADTIAKLEAQAQNLAAQSMLASRGLQACQATSGLTPGDLATIIEGGL